MKKIIGAIIGGFFGVVVALGLWAIIASTSDINSNGTKWLFAICVFIGGLMGFCYKLSCEEEEQRQKEIEERREKERREAEERRKKEEEYRKAEERRQQEELRRQEEFKTWTNELDTKYDQIYDYCNKQLQKGVIINETGSLHESIWDMKKTVLENWTDEHQTEYNNRLYEHRKFLRNRVIEITNKDGIFYLRGSLNALIILRDSYCGDEDFVPAINALKDAVECVNKEMCYITQEEYGRIIFPLQENAEQEEMQRKLERIEEKINNQSSLIKKDVDGYFTGIFECFSDNYIRQIAGLMWYYAWKKPFNVQKFSMAEKAYNRFTVDYKNGTEKIPQVESVLARIYAKNQIGGMGTVRSELDYMNAWLETQISWKQVKSCCALASGLAWMDLYELEREVLRKLVAAGLQLPEDVQERLSFLESGGTSDVKLYMDVPKDKFYFDSSATEWKTTEYDVFFRKAAMKKVVLGYSLTVSKWTKTLPLVSGQKVDSKEIYAEFEKMVQDFDGTVACERTEAQAINLENLEYEDAVLFRFSGKRSRCVSMLFASEKYGKNLNITILTLFTPEDGIGYEELQKYAMAINENVYVESFKESILQSVDEVIKVKKTVYEEETVRKVFE